MRRQVVAALLAVSLWATIGGPYEAAGQESVDGPYVLHEFWVPSSSFDPAPGEGFGPRAEPVTTAGAPPGLSLEAAQDEPIIGTNGPVAARPIAEPYGPLTPFSAENTLDDRTDRVKSLTYYATFQPSVIPFKRVVARNLPVRRDDGTYSLVVRGQERRAVEIGESPGADAELFWGTFLLRAEPNRWHPIASVAPDQRILQLQTEPAVNVEVFRDSADNYFVRTPHAGLLRLNMHLAVSRQYFTGAFADVEWTDLESARTASMARELRARGRRVAKGLGIDPRSTRPAEALTALVEYFRDFDARPFPRELKGQDLYESLVSNKIGVCRHRSTAFVITAQALGIPTRYVYNEAHAFVEVHWPGAGWRRIDLGGAADELNAAATQGRQTHDPGPDGLPEPQRYLQEQGRMQRGGWDAPSHGAPPTAANDAQAAPREVAEQAGEPAAPSADGSAPSGDTPGNRDEQAEPPEVHEAHAPPEDPRTATHVELSSATEVARRGGAVRVTGLMVEEGSGTPIAARQVEVYLGPVGSIDPRSAVKLGVAFTHGDGGFSVELAIPREQAIGRWSLFVHFPGDEEYRPASAD